MISFYPIKKSIGIQTEEDIVEEDTVTNRIEDEIDKMACKLRFQEFVDKTNSTIYKKVAFNIRNYIVLSNRELNEVKTLDDTHKMNIIILFNSVMKYLLKI
jgi:hypothetical protein